MNINYLKNLKKSNPEANYYRLLRDDGVISETFKNHMFLSREIYRELYSSSYDVTKLLETPGINDGIDTEKYKNAWNLFLTDISKDFSDENRLLLDGLVQNNTTSTLFLKIPVKNIHHSSRLEHTKSRNPKSLYNLIYNGEVGNVDSNRFEDCIERALYFEQDNNTELGDFVNERDPIKAVLFFTQKGDLLVGVDGNGTHRMITAIALDVPKVWVRVDGLRCGLKELPDYKVSTDIKNRQKDSDDTTHVGFISRIKKFLKSI